MIRKEYIFGEDTREAIVKVAGQVYDILGKTLGPAGRNYQIPEGITNDGVSILSHIRFPNECEDNIILAFHEIARKTDKKAGDGTTTASVFGAVLTLHMMTLVPDIDTPIPGQDSVMDLSRKLQTEADKAISLLEKKVVPVTTLEELEQVARTSMEDDRVAKIVAETIFKAGPDSFTALEDGFSGDVETEVQSGIEMPLKVAAPFMFNRGDKAEYDGSIPVLVANHLFEDYKELLPFMTSLTKSTDKGAKFPAIVIVGKKFSVPFIRSIKRIYDGSRGAINILLVSNEHLDDSLFEDTAAFCDAKYIDTHPKNGVSISSAQFENCGLVSRVICTEKGVVFYGGKGTILNPEVETTCVAARVLQLRSELSKEKNTKNREALERRISEFLGGKATIYVDAPTATDKFYLKLKVQDCMNSCKSALEGGKVRGGGLSFKEIAEELGEDSLLYKALMAPYECIQKNAGGELEIADDVFDSFLVTKAGIESAVSVIRKVITIEGVIADHPTSMVEELANVIHNPE